MRTSDITALDEQEFSTMESAHNAIKSILQFSGEKETQSDGYTTFISLKKEILLYPGESLYSIWIKNTYNKQDKKVCVIHLQTEHTMSMSIKPFILKAVEEGTKVLTDDMKALVNS